MPGDGDAWTPAFGAPQGAVFSRLLSNDYLDPLDHLTADSGFEMVRYADDFVVLCRTREAALKQIHAWVTAAGLTLHESKTTIVDSRVESFAFLVTSFGARNTGPVARAFRSGRTLFAARRNARTKIP